MYKLTHQGQLGAAIRQNDDDASVLSDAAYLASTTLSWRSKMR